MLQLRALGEMFFDKASRNKTWQPPVLFGS
jgi:hypothetical protein